MIIGINEENLKKDLLIYKEEKNTLVKWTIKHQK